MDDATFKIIFKGEIAPGIDINTVKQNMAALFKTAPSNIETLFTGKLFNLKEGLTMESAQRYKQGFEKTGARCMIIDMSLPAAPKTPATPSQQEPEETAPSPEAELNPMETEEPDEDLNRFLMVDIKKKSNIPKYILAAILLAIVAMVVNTGIKRMKGEAPAISSGIGAPEVAALSSKGTSIYYESNEYYTITIPNDYMLTDQSRGGVSDITFSYPGKTELSILVVPLEASWNPQEEMLKMVNDIGTGKSTSFNGFVVHQHQLNSFNGLNGFELMMRKENQITHFYKMLSITNRVFSIVIHAEGKNAETDHEVLSTLVTGNLMAN